MEISNGVKIFQKGEKVLHEKAKEISVAEIKSGKIQKIIKQMEKAIFENAEALAIAAPQIGEGLRIFVISEWTLNPKSEKPKTEFKNFVFINPKIVKTSKKKAFFPEGCLSAPEFTGTTLRPEKVTVEAYDRNGKKFQRGASGLLAQAIQHEIDHLDGTLFIDKATALMKNPLKN